MEAISYMPQAIPAKVIPVITEKPVEVFEPKSEPMKPVEPFNKAAKHAKNVLYERIAMLTNAECVKIINQTAPLQFIPGKKKVTTSQLAVYFGVPSGIVSTAHTNLKRRVELGFASRTSFDDLAKGAGQVLENRIGRSVKKQLVFKNGAVAVFGHSSKYLFGPRGVIAMSAALRFRSPLAMQLYCNTVDLINEHLAAEAVAMQPAPAPAPTPEPIVEAKSPGIFKTALEIQQEISKIVGLKPGTMIHIVVP